MNDVVMKPGWGSPLVPNRTSAGPCSVAPEPTRAPHAIGRRVLVSGEAVGPSCDRGVGGEGRLGGERRAPGGSLADPPSTASGNASAIRGRDVLGRREVDVVATVPLRLGHHPRQVPRLGASAR